MNLKKNNIKYEKLNHLIKEKKMKFEEALELVRNRRPVACPNAGFQKQLRQFEA